MEAGLPLKGPLSRKRPLHSPGKTVFLALTDHYIHKGLAKTNDFVDFSELFTESLRLKVLQADDSLRSSRRRFYFNVFNRS